MTSTKNEWKPVFDNAVKEYRGGNYTKSLDLLDQALRLNKHLTIYDTKCATLIKLNKHKEALDVARKMIKLDQDSPKGYRRCAFILKTLKKSKQALAMINLALNALEKQPNKVKEAALVADLKSMKGELQALEQQRLSSFRDPMTILPVEMILEIIELARDTTNDYALSARLSHVNRTWREILLNIPQLWRKCSVTFNGSGKAFKKLDTYYKRANNTPLQQVRIYNYDNKEYRRFYENPKPSLDVNAKVKLSSIELVNDLDSHKNKSVSEHFLTDYITNDMFDKLENLSVAKKVRDPSSLVMTNVDEDLILNRVTRSVDLHYVNLVSLENEPPKVYVANKTMQHFKQVRSFQYSLHKIARLFPSLRSLELSGNMELLDREMGDMQQMGVIDFPKLESLVYMEIVNGESSQQPLMSYNMPHLRRCILQGVHLNVLSNWITSSPLLETLSIRDNSMPDLTISPILGTEKAAQINRLVDSFKNYNELKTLDLATTSYNLFIIKAIIEQKLCPKLRAINLSQTSGTFGRILIDLVKQRHASAEFAPIDEIIVNSCPELEYEAILWLRKYVKQIQCIYETKEESKKHPRQRYRYEKL
ncbi:hypothetical protein E3Q11_04375 [Wallemia mellicola]|nr:hypothetical protein E3Q11_04375 [Wallemia mellicola]